MANPTVIEAQQWAFSCFKAGANKSIEDVGQLPEVIMSDLFGWSRTKLLLSLRDTLTVTQWTAYQQAVNRILAGEPEQYVVGKATFYGRQFQVTPAVLIPRLETEELIDWVLSDWGNVPLKRVLDIGTGSGALAITLALERPQWQLTATDISGAAVAVAQHNALTLKTQLNWGVGDLFAPVNEQSFDLVISNPPYISQREQSLMDGSVLTYEPHEALFAAHDGLAIYERIATQLADHLLPSGAAYFEIGFAQGPAVVALMKAAIPQAEVILKQDVTGHDRMIRVRL